MERRVLVGIILALLLVATMNFAVLDSVIHCAVSDGDLAGCLQSNEPEDWWFMFRHDPNHTGFSNSKAPNTNGTRWQVSTGGSVKSSPAVVDGVVFIGSENGYVYAINVTNGQYVWPPKSVGGSLESSVAVVDGKVFIGSSNGRIYALNKATGAKVWNSSFLGAIESSPTVANAKVFVGASTGIYALHEQNGTRIWNCTTTAPVRSSPAIAYDMVFIGSADKRVYALNATDGRYIWSNETKGRILSSPTVAHKMVFVGSSSGCVYALNKTNGVIIWKYQTRGAIESSPAVAEAEGRVLVFVGSKDGKLYALSKAGGLYWSFRTGSGIESSPAILNGTVFIGSNDNKVYAFRDLPGFLVHDVAVILRVGNPEPYVFEPYKTVVAQNRTANISVIVENQGAFDETFDVVAYASQEIGSELVKNLAAGTSRILTFTWNTTGVPKGNYTISVYAYPVPDESESDKADNIYRSWANVTIQGDVDGDFVVNILDVTAITGAYGARSGELEFRPNSDIDNDGVIKILDVVLCTSRYGDRYP